MKMPDRPITLADWQVRALLDGRLTQLRVPMKPQPLPGAERVVWVETVQRWVAQRQSQQTPDCWLAHAPGLKYPEDGRRSEFRCPYPPGTRLVVKETWSNSALSVYPCPSVWYRADFTINQFDDPALDREHTCPPEYRDTRSSKYGNYSDCFACAAVREGTFRWRSPATMPREFSRIARIVTAARPEMVRKVSEVDAMASGIAVDECRHVIRPDDINWGGAAPEFLTRWQSRYGKCGAPFETAWAWALTVTKEPK